MHEILILAIKGFAGGGLVVAFALLSEGLAPKRFAGLFSAAPAVALAGLTVVLLDKGAHEAHQSATGMIAGAEDARGAIIGGCALMIFAAVAALSLRHLPGAVALLIATGTWLAGALLGYVILWGRQQGR